jgi:hypothetical protein
MRSSRLALLLTAMVAPRSAIGQQQPPTIPSELAVALLDHGESASGNRVPKLVVGHAPAGFPVSLTNLDGAMLVGGVEYPQRVIAVLAFSRPPNQVAVALEDQLAARGWKHPPPPPTYSSTGEQSGFTTGPNGIRVMWGTDVYCGDSGSVRARYTPAPAGGTYLKLEHSRNLAPNVCTRPRSGGPLMRMLKFPPLHPPRSTTQRPSGAGSGLDGTFISARLTGPLDLRDIVTHYLKELDSAGWKSGAIATTDDIAAASLGTTDPDGREWKGSVSARRLAPFSVVVQIQMSRVLEQ